MKFLEDLIPLLRCTPRITFLEVLGPFPLLGIGILGILNPLLVGVAVVFALLPWIARLCLCRQSPRYVFLSGPLALLVSSGFMSLWVTYDPALSGPMLLTLLGSINLFFVILNTSVSFRLLGKGLIITASLLAFYFVGQYGHFGYAAEAGRLANLGQMIGSRLPNIVFFTPQVNALANFVEGVFLLSGVFAWQARGGQRLIWGVILLIISCALLLSQSRGAWLGLGVAMSIWLMILSPNRGLRVALSIAGWAGGLVSIYILIRFVQPDQQLFFFTSEINAAHSRFSLYRNSFYLWGDYLFTGIGLGDTFAMVYSRYQLLIAVPFLTYAHNLFLSIGLSLGLVGLIAWTWLLSDFYRFVIHVERDDLSSPSLAIFRAAWLGVTATFVHGLLDSPQFSARWTMPMLFAMLGLSVASGQAVLGERRSKITSHRHHRWPKVIWIPVTITLTVMAVIFWRPLASTWYANIGAIYQTQADLGPDLDEVRRQAMIAYANVYFQEALRLNPEQPSANRRLGMIALDRHDFKTAVSFLEQAYSQEPRNQATLKALGYAYLWTGQLDPAQKLFQQRDNRSELVEELGNWHWWWGTQHREDLATYAGEMAQRLAHE